MKKKLRLLALLCVLCLIFTGCGSAVRGLMFLALLSSGSGDHMTQAQIGELIRDHHEELEEDILDGRAKEWEGKMGVQSVSTKEDGRVDFDCGGWGIVSEGGYMGFYYAPDDQPFDILSFTDGPLTPRDGGWAWQQEDGDNSFFTQRVTERFFRYEYHF